MRCAGALDDSSKVALLDAGMRFLRPYGALGAGDPGRVLPEGSLLSIEVEASTVEEALQSVHSVLEPFGFECYEADAADSG